MREIKFRAWNTMAQQWQTDYDGLTCDGRFLTLDLEGVYHVNLDVALVYQQYTGLKDKNGKEIYEGDIVVYVEDVIVETIEGHSRYEPEGYIGTVKFENASFYVDGEEFYSYGEQNFTWEQLEIIGNIYESPELLK